MTKKRKRWKKQDAKRPLKFNVTQLHVQQAICRDPMHCVLALALQDALGDLFETVEVGATITKVYRADGVVIRYNTPGYLKRSLQEFDRTGEWYMDLGWYEFKPPRPSRGTGVRNRLNLMTPEQRKGGVNRHKKKKPKPRTRIVSRIDAALPGET